MNLKIQTIQNPTNDTIDFFEKRIEEFNVARWDIKKKLPIAIEVKNDSGDILAGAVGKTFGYWLFVDNLWVHESLRGQNWGEKILAMIERAGIERGCKYVFLETLEFQAKPFYEKYGYKLEWTQNNYPRSGQKFFMSKSLLISSENSKA